MHKRGMLHLKAEITPPDESGYWSVVFPELGVGSQGETLEKASANASEALFLWFEYCIKAGTLDQALLECDIDPNKVQSLHQELMQGFMPPSFMEKETVCHA